MNSQALHKILIVRLGALGDVIHVLPSLDALREALPGARIHWAVETSSASLLENHPFVDAVHVIRRKEWEAKLAFPARWAEIGREAAGAVASLREERFDLAVDFQGNLRSGVVTYASGAPSRIGFAKGSGKESSHLFYTERVAVPEKRLHKAVKDLLLLGPLGIARTEARAALPEAFGGSQAVREAMRRKKRPLAVFHGGVSRFGSLKAYPSASLADAARLVAERGGGEVLLTFGPAEKEEAERTAAEAGPGVTLAPETGFLPDLVEIFRAADAVCGVDTGPVQLAAAAGAPVVALYGPKDPEVYAPLGEKVRVLVASDPSLDCLPCNGRRCPRAGADGLSPCMKAIEPERVADAVLALFDPL